MEEFQRYLHKRLYGRSPEHKAFAAKPAVRLDCERVAFYLPQFHRCAENDRFWGPGFTEWTNVVRAMPKFVGHYQPRLPGDLGFYDLTLEDNIRRQVDIARNYGLTGFMFYFYWFGGKTVLETPLRIFRKRRDLPFKYFLMWANENWTRRWDGLESEVLLKQTYAADEPERFIRHLCDYLEDERYIRVDGRPVIAVYRASQIPEVAAVTERWRAACVKHGFKDPYLVSALTFDEDDPRPLGFDAAIEFPPHQTATRRTEGPADITERVKAFQTPLESKVFHYAGLVKSQLTLLPREYRMIRTVLPGWDNSSRRRDGKARIFTATTPALFAEWTQRILQEEMKQSDAFRMVCFNAWNEWAEAAYLEPDAYFGYAYLDALHATLARAAKHAREQRAHA